MSNGMGYLLLEGGAEFGGRMSEPDLRAIELAGGFGAPICILPTAAAPDHNHKRAGNNGVRWFQSLGAKNVFAVDVIDAKSANDSMLAKQIRSSKIIYLLGGFPRHLGETLKNSACWDAALEAHQNGAVIAGSSAGAMVMCGHYYDPYEKKLLSGLNLIPNACVLPHHNTFGKGWANPLQQMLPEAVLIGIDERTGMLSTDSVTDSRNETDVASTDFVADSRNRTDVKWEVYGGGKVTLYRSGSALGYGRGENFRSFK